MNATLLPWTLNDIPLVQETVIATITHTNQKYWIASPGELVALVFPLGTQTTKQIISKGQWANADLFNIGLLCEVSTTCAAPEGLELKLKCLKRIYTYNTYTNVDQPNIVWLDVIDVDEGFEEGDDNTIAHMQELVQKFSTTPSLLPDKKLEILCSDRPLVEKIDTIATHTIQTSAARLRYIQSIEHAERLNILLGQANIEDLKPSGPKVISDDIVDIIRETAMPSTIRTRIQRDIRKLQNLNKSTNEYGNLVDYLTWISEIPWGITTRTDFDLSTLIPVLDESHYGLKDVKHHVLEYMTVEQLKGSRLGSVLCFTGPPGVGKTTIAKAIAHASGRQIYKIALGALTDESAIRGHRRTYSGARPGRLIIGLKQTGVMDPLIVLDEMDKLANFKGDPTSALLEVLDPEQNSEFIDRYIGHPVDLSRAMFICTANNPELIPTALRDRCEEIPFRRYTKEERHTILTKFVIPKALQEYNIPTGSIKFNESTLQKLSDINNIRPIVQRVRKLLRMAAVELVINKKQQVSISDEFASLVLKRDMKPKVGF